MIEIRPVRSSQDWEQFIGFPWKIYSGDPNWVPPLRIAVRDMLDVRKNPFFKHAFMNAWLALRGGEVVGRIVGVVDDNHNRFHNEKVAFFGFFESINQKEVAAKLFSTVESWARERGMTTLRGPVNLSTNHEAGLLVDGFESPPSVMMTYNPKYYEPLFDGAGFTKAKDLLAYDVNSNSRFSERLLAQSERLKANGNVSFRTINMRKFADEVSLILDIYNDAWESNWGFVPMQPDEFQHMAKDLKAIVDPNLLLIAEVRGEPAGFGLTLPDVNQVFKKIPDGKLFPTGLVKLLWNLKGPGRASTVNRCRILTLGIKKAFRNFSLGPLFYTEYLKRGPAAGYPVGEASWILEDNRAMNRALEMMCGERTKVYRIYDRPVS
ncbi:N-acetyltransferase [bacterium]|nr:N-acetyltransferase [bacterium]